MNANRSLPRPGRRRFFFANAAVSKAVLLSMFVLACSSTTYERDDESSGGGANRGDGGGDTGGVPTWGEAGQQFAEIICGRFETCDPTIIENNGGFAGCVEAFRSGFLDGMDETVPLSCTPSEFNTCKTDLQAASCEATINAEVPPSCGGC